MAGPFPVDFDVTEALAADACEGRRIKIAGWLFFPDDLSRLGRRPITMVLGAGGSYDKRYHHVEIKGRSGYSAAEHLASLGSIILLADHLGVGESSRLPNQRKATLQVAAQAAHAAVEQFYQRLRAGDLHQDLQPIADFVRIGGGHSMGAKLLILQQAAHRTFDGVMVMGYTADCVHLTMNGKKISCDEFLPEIEQDDLDRPDYTLVSRAVMHETFHWEDVPEDVIKADDALLVETPSCLGLGSVRRGIVREEAGRIDAPVYICLGERDVSPDPHAEPSFFRSSSDITIHILPRSGHCQTFASTRRQMWDRMHHWARSIAH